MYSTPFSLANAISSSLIGRDALEIAVSPLTKRLKPPPVPEVPTDTRTSLFAMLNSSAIASVIGNTVLDPSASIVPDSFSSDVAP